MNRATCVIIAIACLAAAGCRTTGPGSTTETETAAGTATQSAAEEDVKKAAAKPTSKSPAVGKPVQVLIDAADDQKVQIFDAAGKEVTELPKLPPKKTGSVSIHAADGTGQDNYTFDEKYRVIKHMRSYGDDYSAGNWREVK